MVNEYDPSLARTELELDPGEVHDAERAGRMTFSMIILQAIYDLEARDPRIRWDAIYYFHSDLFQEHSWEAGIDPEVALERMIRDGKLPPEVPPPPKIK